MKNRSIINFGKFETASVLANVFIIKIFLGLPGELAKIAATAGWIVALASGIVFLGILAVIFKIYSKNEELDIIEMSEISCGKAFKVIFMVVLCAAFLIKGALALRVSSEIIVTVLPFELPVFACILILTLAAFFAAWKGLEGVVRLHAIFFPIILVAFLFTFFMAFYNSDFTNIFPIFGFGFKSIAKNSLKYIGIYSDIIYIFLLAPHVKNKKIYKKACFGGSFVAVIVIFAVSFSYLAAVPYPESAKLFMPIYQVSRLAGIGSNSQGFEAFLLPEWIISSLLYISLSLYFAADVIKKAFAVKRDKLLVSFAAIAIYILAFVPKTLSEAAQTGTSFVNGFVIFTSLTTVIITFIVKVRRKA